MLTEDVFPPLPKNLRTEENLPFVEKSLLEIDPVTKKRKRLLFQFLKLCKKTFIYQIIHTFAYPILTNFQTYLQADFIDSFAQVIFNRNQKQLEGDIDSFIPQEMKIVLLKKILLYIFFGIFMNFYNDVFGQLLSDQKKGIKIGVEGLILRKVLKMQFLQSSKVKEITEEVKSELEKNNKNRPIQKKTILTESQIENIKNRDISRFINNPQNILQYVEELISSLISIYICWVTFGWAIVVQLIAQYGSTICHTYFIKIQDNAIFELDEDYNQSYDYIISMFRNYSLMKLLTLEDYVFLKSQDKEFVINVKSKKQNWISNVFNVLS